MMEYPKASLGKRVVRDSMLVTAINIGVQGVFFISSMYIAASFGADWRTDAFYLALTIPWMFINVISAAIKSVFVPVFIQHKVQNPEQVKDVINSAVFIVLSIVLVGVIIILLILPVVIPRMASGFTSEGLALFTQLTIGLLPVIVMVSLSGVIGAVYNSYQRFTLPALLGVLNGIFLLLCAVFLRSILGIYSLVVGTLAGSLFELVLLIIFLEHSRIHLKLSFRIHPAVLQMGKLALFPVIGSIFLQFNPLVDRIFASHLTSGNITALNYAEKINVIPSMILGSGFLAVLISHWSQAAAEGESVRVKQNLERVVGILTFVLAPIVVLLFIGRFVIIETLFERGEWDANASEATALAMGYLLTGVIPSYWGMVFARVFLVYQDTFSLFILSILNMVLNWLLNIVLIGPLGLGGIALSTAITKTTIACLLFLFMQRRVGRLSAFAVFRSSASVLAIAICLGLIADILMKTFTQRLTDISSLIGFFLVSIGYMLAYIAIGYSFGIKDIHWGIDLIQQRISGILKWKEHRRIL